MTDDNDFTSAKMPMFSGKKDSWAWWSELFLARAKKKKYKNILLDSTVKIPKTGQKDDDGNLKPLTEDEKLIAEKNDLAYGDLISAMDAKKEGGKWPLT